MAPRDYEHVYIAEVLYAKDYIEQATLQAWRDEAAAAEAEVRAGRGADAQRCSTPAASARRLSYPAHPPALAPPL